MSYVETLINWIVVAGVVILFGVILASWLASYRVAKAAPIPSGDWFFRWPAWVQIGGGLAGCLLFGYLGSLLWFPLPLDLSPQAAALLRVVGFLVFIMGWILALWARWTLGALYGVSTGFAAPLQAEHRLIRDGPYAFVRHPMYLGYWLVLVGLTLMYRTWTPWVFFLVCLASFYRRARREDDALAERFGEEWSAYAARTKFIIPFVY